MSIQWKKFEDEKPSATIFLVGAQVRIRCVRIPEDFFQIETAIPFLESRGWTHWAYVNLPHEEGREYTPEVEDES
jgi:hypothetical protein